MVTDYSRRVVVDWSTKTEVKLGTLNLDKFWKVEFARTLITTLELR